MRWIETKTIMFEYSISTLVALKYSLCTKVRYLYYYIGYPWLRLRFHTISEIWWPETQEDKQERKKGALGLTYFAYPGLSGHQILYIFMRTWSLNSNFALNWRILSSSRPLLLCFKTKKSVQEWRAFLTAPWAIITSIVKIIVMIVQLFGLRQIGRLELIWCKVGEAYLDWLMKNISFWVNLCYFENKKCRSLF